MQSTHGALLPGKGIVALHNSLPPQKGLQITLAEQAGKTAAMIIKRLRIHKPRTAQRQFRQMKHHSPDSCSAWAQYSLSCSSLRILPSR